MSWLLTAVGAATRRDSDWFARRHDRVRTLVDGIALALFGWLATDDSLRHDRQQTLRAIHAEDGYQVVAARTMLVAVAAGLLAGCCSLVAIPAIFDLVSHSVHPSTPWPSGPIHHGPPTVIGLTVVGTVLLAGGVAVGVHEARWWWFDRRAAARERRIEATLPRAVAFMYALARSGMPLPRILRTLADNEAVYGEAAAEFGVAVREIDAVGTDVLTALERTRRRTPSDALAELTASLTTVVDSDQQLADYLATHHERCREAAAADQEQELAYLSAAAEAYVTVLVVGLLFVLTTLTIIGLVVTDTLPVLRGLVYLAVPLGTLGFLLGLDQLGSPRDPPDTQPRPTPTTPDPSTAPDTESTDRWATQRATLRLYDRLDPVYRRLRRPRATLLAAPWLTCLVTVPAGIAWLWLTVPTPAATVIGLVSLVRPISAVAVVVCGGYAAVYELAAYRRRRFETPVPAFLDRLGSRTDAGLSVVDAVERVADSDLAALTPAVERAWRDIQWGADLETALQRLAGRVQSPRVVRAVTLVTNAARASNDIAPVVSIAAEELRARRRLDRDRRRLVAMYLVVIYVAFLVFVGIVAALSATFLPAVGAMAADRTAATADTAAAGGATAVGTSTHLTAGNLAAYRSLFFQAAAVQAVCSGLVAGTLADGTLRGGVKHVAALLALAHVGFWFI